MRKKERFDQIYVYNKFEPKSIYIIPQIYLSNQFTLRLLLFIMFICGE